MSYFSRCDECGKTISEGTERKPHVNLTRYSGEGRDYATDYDGGRDFCDVACLKAYLDAGKEV